MVVDDLRVEVKRFRGNRCEELLCRLLERLVAGLSKEGNVGVDDLYDMSRTDRQIWIWGLRSGVTDTWEQQSEIADSWLLKNSANWNRRSRTWLENLLELVLRNGALSARSVNLSFEVLGVDLHRNVRWTSTVSDDLPETRR